MLDAVWHQEMRVASRRQRNHFLRWAYAAILLVQLLPLGMVVLIASFMPVRERGDALIAPFAWFFESVITQHFVFLLLLTPALTAGALTDEKTRRTLDDLLTTAARPWSLVVGKLLSRSAQVLLLSLVSLPFACFFGVYGRNETGLPLALLVASAIFVVGLAGLSLLASALCRQTRDAVLATYAALLLGAYLLGQLPGGFAELLSPWQAVALEDPAERGPRLVRLALAWLPAALAWTAAASVLLRPMYLRQLRAVGPRRWPWGGRHAPVGDDPVVWREQSVLGLTPLAWLRACPRWLGFVAVGLLLAASLLWLLTDFHQLGAGLTELVTNGDPTELLRAIEAMRGTTRAYDRAAIHAFLAALGFTLLVAVRASGAICEERERGTWEPLLLTPLTTRQLVHGKFRGILRAALPYLAVYLLAVLPLALLLGPGLTRDTAVFLGVALLALAATALISAALAALGLCCSSFAQGAWRSLFATVGLFYVSSLFIVYILYVVVFVVGLVGWFVLALLTRLWKEARGQNPGAPFEVDEASLVVLVVGVGIFGLLLTAAIFLSLTYALLRMAESRIEARERVASRVARWKQ